MTSIDTSEDELFLFWDHILRYVTSYPCLKQLLLELPPPKCLTLERLVTLRDLQYRYINHGIDVSILATLEKLRTMSGTNSKSKFAMFLKPESVSDSESQPSKKRWFQLQLAVAREAVLYYLRKDEYGGFSECVSLFRKKKRYFREMDESQEKEYNDSCEEFAEALDNSEYCQHLIKKYPLAQCKKLLESFIASEWKRTGDSFLKRAARDVEEGRYRPPTAFNMIQEWPERAQDWSPSLDIIPKQIGPGILPCSSGSSFSFGKGSQRNQPMEHSPIGRSFPSRSVLPDLPKATAEEIQFAYPGSPTVLNEPEGPEETPHPNISRKRDCLISSPPYGNGIEGLSRVPAPPWADKASQSVSLEERTRTTGGDERRKEKDALCQKIRRKSMAHLGEKNDQQAFGSVQDQGGGMIETPIALADLRNSSSQLRNMGVDPLPEALNFADQALRNTHQPGHERRQEEEMDTARGDGFHSTNSHVQADACPEFGMPLNDTGAPSVVQRESVTHQTEENGHSIRPRVIHGQPTSTSAPNISLNRKPSARQDHWDSEGEVDINEEPPPRYQASTLRQFSPLEKERESPPRANTVRNRLQVRRKNRAWSLQEIKCLKDGVTMFDRKWRRIKEHFSDVFYDRTYVDLKDKYRNLQKVSEV